MRTLSDADFSPRRFVLRRASAVCWLVVASSLVGCAHKPPAPEPAPARPQEPVVVKLPPPEAQAPAVDPDADLEALLRESVLRFDFDRSSLSSESMTRLQRIAEAMRAHPSARVRVAGHCDERGTQEYNVTLGQQRAQAARSYLMSLGVAGDRIDTVSYGAEAPADSGHNEEAWARNRRDELTRTR